MTTSGEGGKAPGTKPSFADLVRKVALASVGAVVLAQEEIEDFVGKLVQKGELAEKDGKSLVKDVIASRADLAESRKRAEASRDGAGGITGAVTTAVDTTVDRVLHRINVPTRTDLEELARKIDEIDRKVEALAATKRS